MTFQERWREASVWEFLAALVIVAVVLMTVGPLLAGLATLALFVIFVIDGFMRGRRAKKNRDSAKCGDPPGDA